MTPQPEIPPARAHEITPVCLGVMCPIHGQCLRYAAADFSTSRTVRIYFCTPARSLFIPKD